MVQLPIPNWLVLWGYYLMTGTSSLRKTQYNIIRDLLSLAFASNLLHFRMREADFIGAVHPLIYRGTAFLPSFTSICRYSQDVLYPRLTVPIREVQLLTTRYPASSFMNTIDVANVGNRMVNMVMPSSYALEDIATPATWRHFRPQTIIMSRFHSTAVEPMILP